MALMLPGKFQDTVVRTLPRDVLFLKVVGLPPINLIFFLWCFNVGVDHGFTEWSGRAYDPLAEWRSWDAMLSVFDIVLSEESEEMLGTDIVESSGDETAVERVFTGDFP